MGAGPRVTTHAKNRMRDMMNSSRTPSRHLFAILFLLPGVSLSWPAAPVENGFLRKKDFHISSDSAYALKSTGKFSPVGMDFDFSTVGDTGAAMKATGRVFSTAWKSKCTDERSNCDFFLTVLQQAKDSASLPINGSELHTRVYAAGSKAMIEIATKIIHDGNTSKLESKVTVAEGDSISERVTNRKAGNFSLPKAQQGYELKFSLITTMGKQKLFLYTKQIDGAFKLAQAKVALPAGFSADSIGFLITDSSGGAKNILSDAFAGSRTWNYVAQNEAAYLKKFSTGAHPGKLANHDYFGQAIFLLIKSSEGSGDRFGTWESYVENTKMLRNASEGGELLPIQILRTTIHEKSARGSMVETPVFICTSPRQDLTVETAHLFLDPGSLFGDGELKEVRVKDGKTAKTLAVGEKLKIDFKDGAKKSLDLEVVYKDGFKAKVPMMFRGPSKN
jgi:hypothetical protein